MSPYRDLLSSLLSSLSPRALVAGQGSLQHHLDSKISKLVDGASRRGDIWPAPDFSRNVIPIQFPGEIVAAVATWWRWWSPRGPLSSRHKDCQHAHPLPQRLDHRSVYVSPRRVSSIKWMFSRCLPQAYESKPLDPSGPLTSLHLTPFGGPHLPRLSIDYRSVSPWRCWWCAHPPRQSMGRMKRSKSYGREAWHNQQTPAFHPQIVDQNETCKSRNARRMGILTQPVGKWALKLSALSGSERWQGRVKQCSRCRHIM